MSDIKKLVRRLRNDVSITSRLGLLKYVEMAREAATALEALHAECAQWQEAAAQAAVRGEHLEDRCEALERERDSMTALIADLVKLIPLGDTLSASATGETLVAYFRERLSRAESAEAEVARQRDLIGEMVSSCCSVNWGDEQTSARVWLQAEQVSCVRLPASDHKDNIAARTTLSEGKAEATGRSEDAPAITPHHYYPSVEHMGDCRICGNVAGHPIHLELIVIDHDGFVGTPIGHYTRRDGKRGVVLQQVGTNVVHVYGEKWIKPAAPAPEDRSDG